MRCATRSATITRLGDCRNRRYSYSSRSDVALGNPVRSSRRGRPAPSRSRLDSPLSRVSMLAGLPLAGETRLRCQPGTVNTLTSPPRFQPSQVSHNLGIASGAWALVARARASVIGEIRGSWQRQKQRAAAPRPHRPIGSKVARASRVITRLDACRNRRRRSARHAQLARGPGIAGHELADGSQPFVDVKAVDALVIDDDAVTSPKVRDQAPQLRPPYHPARPSSGPRHTDAAGVVARHRCDSGARRCLRSEWPRTPGSAEHCDRDHFQRDPAREVEGLIHAAVRYSTTHSTVNTVPSSDTSLGSRAMGCP